MSTTCSNIRQTLHSAHKVCSCMYVCMYVCLHFRMIITNISQYFASSVIPVVCTFNEVLSMTANRDIKYNLHKYPQNVQNPYLIPPTGCS
jgi:hypothetical protein